MAESYQKRCTNVLPTTRIRFLWINNILTILFATILIHSSLATATATKPSQVSSNNIIINI